MGPLFTRRSEGRGRGTCEHGNEPREEVVKSISHMRGVGRYHEISRG